jgi:hypothetical protein
MAKEHIWNIRVDGTRHVIVARDKGNGFDVYVDDEFRFNVRSDINLDIEEDLTVGSKRCRVVVYRGVPDLAVDGILLDAEAALLKQEKRSRALTIACGIGLVLLGLFAMWMYIAMNVSGQSFYFGGFGPVFAILVSAAGVALTIVGIRKKGV